MHERRNSILSKSVRPLSWRPRVQLNNGERFRQLYSVLVSRNVRLGARYWPPSITMAPFEFERAPFARNRTRGLLLTDEG
jgi:hypothetical protein